MSKTPSRKLYQLIKSLTGSEKRYFKLFINKTASEKDSKYLILFDAIDKQVEFDDEQLQQIVYQGEEIQSRKYSELKAYLYDLILKALQGFDEKSSVDYRLKGMLQSIRVLYKRGHYDDCKEILQKTKKIANKYENFTCILELLKWEKHIAYTLIDVAYLDTELERIDAKEKECLQQLQNLSDYKNLFFRLLTTVKKANFTTRQELCEYIKKMADTPLLSDDNSPQSHGAKVLYYRFYSLYHYLWSDFGLAHQYSQALLYLMESKPFFLREDVSEYISIINNHALICKHYKKHDERKQILSKLLEIKPNTYDDKLKIHRQYYVGMFDLCVTSGMFEEGCLLVEEHFSKLGEFANDQEIFQRSAFYLSYFYLYFGVGKYEKALEHLNALLNSPKSLERQDLQVLARILNLLVHYELDNIILLESLLRSTYRFLRKIDSIRPLERKILNFVKNSTKVYSKKDRYDYFLQLQKDIKELSPLGRLGPFDLAAWVESKISRKDFAEVVQEKHQRLHA